MPGAPVSAGWSAGALAASERHRSAEARCARAKEERGGSDSHMAGRTRQSLSTRGREPAASRSWLVVTPCAPRELRAPAMPGPPACSQMLPVPDVQ